MKDIYIDESPRGGSLGRGVFADRAFKRADIVEACPVIPISEEDFAKLKDTALENYPFSWKGTGTCMVLGYGSLYNHSDTPNIAWVDVEMLNLKTFFALRDIEEGEELLFDYNNEEYKL